MGGLQPTEDWIRRALAVGQIRGHREQTVDRALRPRIDPPRPPEESADPVWRIGGRRRARDFRIARGIGRRRTVQDRGILNGTCNYILSQIEANGIPFATALREAQKLGFAEADPTEDIDGFDARAKLAILARVGLHCMSAAESIWRARFQPIDAVDFEYAKQLGCTIRQISWADARIKRVERAESHRSCLPPSNPR
jgi:homoserine dehydrogenase